MRAYIGALVTLYAVIGLPFRYPHSYAALFIFCCSCRECAVFPSPEGADRKVITFLCYDRIDNVPYKFRNIIFFFGLFLSGIIPGVRHIYLHHITSAVDSCIVHINDFFSFITI